MYLAAVTDHSVVPGLRTTLKRLLPDRIRRAWRTFRLVRPEARPALLRLWLSGLARPEDALPGGLPTGPSLLFVCYGNILRSAAAEALFRRLNGRPAPGTVASCGVGATPGRAADSRGQRIGRELGVDLSGHRARALTQEQVLAADLILVMDQLNAAEVLTQFPEARPRLRYLGAFGPPGTDWPEIPDPFLGDEEAVRRAFRRIEAAVARLSRDLGLAS